jgi:hypothetical protein
MGMVMTTMTTMMDKPPYYGESRLRDELLVLYWVGGELVSPYPVKHQTSLIYWAVNIGGCAASPEKETRRRSPKQAPLQLRPYTYTRQVKSRATSRVNMKAARSLNHRGLHGEGGLWLCMRRPQQLYRPRWVGARARALRC